MVQQVNCWLLEDEALEPPPFLSWWLFIILHPTAAFAKPYERTSLWGVENYRMRREKECFKTEEWMEVFSTLMLVS